MTPEEVNGIHYINCSQEYIQQKEREKSLIEQLHELNKRIYGDKGNV